MVNETIELLLNLQEFDLKIGELKAEHDVIPGRLEEMDNVAGQLEQAVQEGESRLKALKVAIREAESKIALLEETDKRYEQQLNAVKTNREYSALLTERQSTKKENDELEESVIRDMERSETVADEITGARQKHEEYQAQSRDQQEELKGRAKTLSEQIGVERQKRDNLAVRIDPQVIRLYERIMNSRGKKAVVSLRNGSCGGCFAVVPLQRVTDIRKGGRLYTCDSCGRILYYEE